MIRLVRAGAPAAAAALLFALPIAGRAQDTVQEPPRLLPGDPAVDGRRIAPGTRERRLLLTQNGEERQLATVSEEVTEIQVDGRSALRRVQSVRLAIGVATDTVVVLRETLAPVRHRSHNPQRVLSLDFDGAKVTGSITPAGGEPRPVAAELDAPVFDSNPLDLLLRALPLAEGYAVRIPIYIHELGGRVWVATRVAGSETVEAGEGGTEDAWVVEVEAQGRTSRFWIAKASRELLRQGSSPAPGVELKVVR